MKAAETRARLRAAAAGTMNAYVQASSPDGQPLILLVDEHGPALEQIVAELHSRGLRTMCVEDGATALNVAEKYHPNVILAAVELPDMDGCTLCAEFKSRMATADTPVVLFCSARRSDDLLQRCFQAGANDLLAKPVSQVELLGRIQVALREQEIREAYKRLAVLDAMTGLVNRRHFILHVTEALMRTRQGGTSSAIILGDVDGLATINEHHGHDLGDEVILTFARLLTRLASPDCKAGRLGGDEFALAIMETDRQRALRVARRLRNTFSAIAFDAASRPKHFYASFGVAIFDGQDPAFNVDDFLNQADQALFAAKQVGHGRVCGYWELDAAALASVPRKKRHARARARVRTQRAFVAAPEEPADGPAPAAPADRPGPQP